MASLCHDSWWCLLTVCSLPHICTGINIHFTWTKRIPADMRWKCVKCLSWDLCLCTGNMQFHWNAYECEKFNFCQQIKRYNAENSLVGRCCGGFPWIVHKWWQINATIYAMILVTVLLYSTKHQSLSLHRHSTNFSVNAEKNWSSTINLHIYRNCHEYRSALVLSVGSLLTYSSKAKNKK